MKLYEYAVIKQEKTDPQSGDVIEKASVVVPVTTLLARDDDQANLLAARSIPDEEVDNIDRLTVVLRPF